MHESTFEYLKPQDWQITAMEQYRKAAKQYADVLAFLPEGPDKTFIMRNHRTTAMWVNQTLTRLADGSPRIEEII